MTSPKAAETARMLTCTPVHRTVKQSDPPRTACGLDLDGRVTSFYGRWTADLYGRHFERYEPCSVCWPPGEEGC